MYNIHKNNWSGGQLLAFSGIDGKTDYQLGLTARTSFCGTQIEIKLPGECNLLLSKEKPLRAKLSGDYFEIDTVNGVFKGAFPDAYHLLIEGKIDCPHKSDELAFIKQENKILIGTKDYFNEKLIKENIDLVIHDRKVWKNKIQFPKNLNSVSKLTFEKAISQLKTQVYSPEQKIQSRWTTPDRWPHRDMWLWDSAFHAIGFRHLDLKLARDSINAVLDLQHESGFIPHCASPFHSSTITQPPVLALAVKAVEDKEQSIQWLRKIYPKLKAYLEWDLNNRDLNKNGLLEWHIEEHINCRSGESGMDNSPRFDSALALDAVDFNSYLSHEFEIMSLLAKRLDIANDVELWQIRHNKINAAINKYLWNDNSGFYFDYNNQVSKQSTIWASSGFLPLICGAASKKQAKQLLLHLKDKDKFNTEFPVPSIAKFDYKNYSKDMWRGPVWININWLIAYGLKRYGFVKEADELLKISRQKIEKYYIEHGTFFEFYDDRCELAPPELLRKGKNAPDEAPTFQVLYDFGWSAALYLDIIYSDQIKNVKNKETVSECIPI